MVREVLVLLRDFNASIALISLPLMLAAFLLFRDLALLAMSYVHQKIRRRKAPH
jgi:hypothetical protein